MKKRYARSFKARVCEDYKGHFIETDVNVNKRSTNVVLKQMVGKIPNFIIHIDRKTPLLDIFQI